MQVAAGRDVRGVEIGVSVEPDHPQVTAGGTAVRRHRADGANGQAVIAPHEQRHRTRTQGFTDLVVDFFIFLI